MTATAVPRSPVTGGDLGNVGEMSGMSPGMSGQMSKMSAKCCSDVRDVPVQWKSQTAREVHGQ
jgi:hypothetical protein